MSQSEDEDHYEIPLRDQRYFGAGLKRKRVQFVPSTSSTTTEPTSLPGTPSAASASDRYLSIVFGKSASEPASAAPSPRTGVTAVSGSTPDDQTTARTARTARTAKNGLLEEERGDVGDTITTCEICSLPISATNTTVPHEASLVHQICLPHAHPPSALDRTRKGLSILEAYGWNPDQRLGLGAAGEGILHPIKAKEKRDKIGLGVGNEAEADAASARLKNQKTRAKVEKEVPKLDAGKIKKMEKEQRRKDQRLREMFYASEDMDKYLGTG